MSETEKYNWQRYWGPRDAKLTVTASGALEDPEGAYGHILNPQAKTLDSLADVRCLALLGEPGSGKSVEIDRQVELLNNSGSDANLLHFQLRDFQTDLKLCQDIFDNNPTFQAWIGGQDRLYLYLDSLDEGLLNVSSLATLLVRELKKYSADRLYVRIACRTAEWPEILETGLTEHWDPENFRVYELLPLREKDIAEAAQSEDADPKAFFDELNRKTVGPLAVKPVTLRFLLKLFQRHGQLPATQSALYAEGCRYLCEESSLSRIASHRRGRLTADKRLLVAQRIAAISIFSNKSAIWTGLTTETPESDIAVEELASGSEGKAVDEFHIGEDEIREASSTGLFSSRGLNRIGWAHQTYAEFLAARYLIENGVSLDQRLALIMHSDGKSIPQLHETASWLASMDLDVFREIMKSDPVVLLRSDVASADNKDKIALVEALLEGAENQEWIDRDWSLNQFYSKLKHDTLAQQLTPFIAEKTKGIFARRIAADIAEACEVLSLQDALAEVALDTEDDMVLRVNAAYAVMRIADSQTKSKLRPLAFGEAGDDPDDELKGVALQALWPDHLSSEELFELLRHPKRPSLYGSYKSFLSHLASDFDQADLVLALKWLARDAGRFDSLSPFRSIGNEILRRAWANVETPAVADALADIIVANVRHLRGDEEDSFGVDDEKRHTVLESVISRLAENDKPTAWYGLIYSESRLIVASDLPWLVNLLISEQSPRVQKLLAEIISRILDPRSTQHVGLVIDAASKSSALAATCGWFIYPVYLNSEQAEIQKRTYTEAQEMNRGIPMPPPLDPPPIERVRLLLNRFESGETTAWWRLNLEMTLQEDSRHYGDESQSNLTKLPGWSMATPEDKQRIIDAAKRYLAEGDPEPKKWLDKDIIWRPAYAGYRALRLVFEIEPDFLLALPVDCWHKWACIVVAYPFQNETSDAEAQARLVELAYRQAPDEVNRVVLLLISKANKSDGYLSALGQLKYCWGEQLAQALAKKMKRGKLKTGVMGQILSELIAHNVAEAKHYAEQLVKRNALSLETQTRALTAARSLAAYADDAGWGTIWPHMQQNANFGRQLIESISSSVFVHKTPIAARLTDEQLGDLFIWLAREYPHSTDPRHEGVFAMGPDDHARNLRDSVLNQLKQRGTAESVATLERIARELPELEWLKWIVIEAREIKRRESWIPATPAEILRIAHDRDSLLVQTGEHLIQAIVESLKRLEAKLHGETPAAIDLWNEVERETYRPKDENRLSDYVKRHLEDDLKGRGIVANREVQIRRGEGSTEGEQTDIHVDAIAKAPNGEVYDRITSIVETKGCWNRELESAMETQLKDRYLKNNACRFGLYLVGWFNCQQWDQTDRREKQSPKITKDEAQAKFDEQASSLSDHSVTLSAFVLDAAL
jgi:hypothetical protein